MVCTCFHCATITTTVLVVTNDWCATGIGGSENQIGLNILGYIDQAYLVPALEQTFYQIGFLLLSIYRNKKDIYKLLITMRRQVKDKKKAVSGKR